MFLSFCGKTPRDEGAAFVAPSATVQGDVVLKPGSTVWYGAVLRGDDGTLTIGKNSNVQDNAVLHCDIGGCVTLGENVTVGHCALVHGCTVGDGSLIGMHAPFFSARGTATGNVTGAAGLSGHQTRPMKRKSVCRTLSEQSSACSTHAPPCPQQRISRAL